MIRVDKLTKQYHELLFENVTFLLGNKEKVGLIGLNGCGKTSLLKILAGIEKADSGQVEVANEVIGYLPQEFTFEEKQLVGEFLENLVDDHLSELYKVNIILSKLNEENIDHYQEILKLSEGQKMKLKLTEILIDQPTILLLDEPTNHLDIQGILWFEDFIKSYDGVCIIISHDREFLNNTCNNIFEIDEQKLLVFEGNYDDYIIHKEDYIAERDKEYRSQERKRKQLDDLLLRARSIKGGGKKRGKAVKAAKSRMRREVLEKEVSKYTEKKVEKFSMDGFVHSKKKIVEVENLEFGYLENKPVLENTDLLIYGKDRLWLYGPNGIGKTTFIKLLTGEEKPNKGLVSWGENISWTYFSQDQKHLNMELTVEEYFLANTDTPYDKSFGILEKFLFPKELRNYKLKTLSPGQRARLSFTCFTKQKHDFLILDEPTNHLDIRTKEVIEDALRKFDGAIFMISHDRYFVDSIGIDRVITIQNQRIVEK